jgi:hypothetical protein
MNYRLRFVAILSALFPFYAAYAGGDPNFVKFPKGYDTAFTHYATINRGNQEQVAKLYANEKALSSYKAGQTADPGTIVVMEIYKPKLDAEGKPVPGSDGIFEIDHLAAVAVMEKKNDWDAEFSPEHRVGNWGFAVYTPEGSPKDNDLNCVECHTPLTNQDYLFTYQQLKNHIQQH